MRQPFHTLRNHSGWRPPGESEATFHEPKTAMDSRKRTQGAQRPKLGRHDALTRVACVCPVAFPTLFPISVLFAFFCGKSHRRIQDEMSRNGGWRRSAEEEEGTREAGGWASRPMPKSVAAAHLSNWRWRALMAWPAERRHPPAFRLISHFSKSVSGKLPAAPGVMRAILPATTRNAVRGGQDCPRYDFPDPLSDRFYQGENFLIPTTRKR